MSAQTSFHPGRISLTDLALLVEKYPNLGYLANLFINSGVEKSRQSPESERLQLLLRLLRQEAQLTQVQLAEKLQQPQSFVSKYEAGERRLDVLELRQVCLALGISLGDFVNRFEKEIP